MHRKVATGRIICNALFGFAFGLNSIIVCQTAAAAKAHKRQKLQTQFTFVFHKTINECSREENFTVLCEQYQLKVMRFNLAKAYNFFSFSVLVFLLLSLFRRTENICAERGQCIRQATAKIKVNFYRTNKSTLLHKSPCKWSADPAKSTDLHRITQTTAHTVFAILLFGV